MANFFPRWTNTLPIKLAVALLFLAGGAALAVTYYFTNKYTEQGYQPSQPIPFSHKLHAGDLQMDCRYCHSFVEVSGHANVPTNETCATCHTASTMQVKTESPLLEKVREASEKGTGVEWTKVHQMPDYVYFNHSVHIARGVSCVSCHGKVNEMEVVFKDQPQSMGWCLDCHRNPEQALRPLDQVTNLDWKPSDQNREEFYQQLLAQGAKPEKLAELITGKPTSSAEEGKYGMNDLIQLANDRFGAEMTQDEIGAQLKNHWAVSPPESCGACHR